MPTNIATNAPQPLLKEQEAAKLLNLKVATLRRWRWQGRGPHFLKIEGAIRYDPEALRAYLANRERSSTSDPGEQSS